MIDGFSIFTLLIGAGFTYLLFRFLYSVIVFGSKIDKCIDKYLRSKR